MKPEKGPRPRIQTLDELRDEMVAVARGERSAPSDARGISFESVDAMAQYRIADATRKGDYPG